MSQIEIQLLDALRYGMIKKTAAINAQFIRRPLTLNSFFSENVIRFFFVPKEMISGRLHGANPRLEDLKILKKFFGGDIEDLDDAITPAE